jgi:hypothetical protein
VFNGCSNKVWSSSVKALRNLYFAGGSVYNCVVNMWKSILYVLLLVSFIRMFLSSQKLLK